MWIGRTQFLICKSIRETDAGAVLLRMIGVRHSGSTAPRDCNVMSSSLRIYLCSKNIHYPRINCESHMHTVLARFCVSLSTIGRHNPLLAKSACCLEIFPADREKRLNFCKV